MTKAAAPMTTKDEKVREAKRAFIVGLMDLSWRLATAFLVPVTIGLLLDKNGSKTYTTVGIFVGIALAFAIIIKNGFEANK